MLLCYGGVQLRGSRPELGGDRPQGADANACGFLCLAYSDPLTSRREHAGAQELAPARRLLFILALDRGEHPRSHFVRKLVLRVFDVDDFGIAWAEAAQFVAYRPGILFVVEHLPPVVIR
jgi:hypothetical protein